MKQFGDREQLVDFELQGARDFREIRLAVIASALSRDDLQTGPRSRPRSAMVRMPFGLADGYH